MEIIPTMPPLKISILVDVSGMLMLLQMKNMLYAINYNMMKK